MAKTDRSSDHRSSGPSGWEKTIRTAQGACAATATDAPIHDLCVEQRDTEGEVSDRKPLRHGGSLVPWVSNSQPFLASVLASPVGVQAAELNGPALD
jgi:hypothetical protein